MTLDEPTEDAPRSESVFGPADPIDYGGAMADDETLFDTIPEPEAAPDPRAHSLKPTGPFANPDSKYDRIIAPLAKYGPHTYRALVPLTRMSHSALTNHGPVLRRAGFIENINPDPHGPRLWAATQAGVDAAGLDHAVVDRWDTIHQVVVGACVADRVGQRVLALQQGQYLTPRSRITSRHAGGVYRLLVGLDGMDPHRYPVDHTPAFVIDSEVQPTWGGGGAATGFELLLREPDPERLAKILRRYAVSAFFVGVRFGSHRQDILDQVTQIAHDAGLLSIVSTELYQPRVTMPFDLQKWADR